MGAFSLCLSQISASNLSRIRCDLHALLGMGQGLLRSHEERSERRAPRGGSFVGVQMDSHHLSMLERRQTVREEVYMETLRRRGSPLVGALALATSAEWKTIAGFQK